MNGKIKIAILGIVIMLSVNFAFGQDIHNCNNQGLVKDVAHIQLINLDVVGYCPEGTFGGWDGWDIGKIIVKFTDGSFSYSASPRLFSNTPSLYMEVEGEYVSYPSNVEITVILEQGWPIKTFTYTYYGPPTTENNPAIIDGNNFPKPLDCLKVTEEKPKPPSTTD